jgi:hypothetical protein
MIRHSFSKLPPTPHQAMPTPLILSGGNLKGLTAFWIPMSKRKRTGSGGRKTILCALVGMADAW